MPVEGRSVSIMCLKRGPWPLQVSLWLSLLDLQALCTLLAGCTSLTMVALLSSGPVLSLCAGHMRAGSGLHCGPGPAAAPHAGRPDPAASARSPSAAHQPPHRAGGA